MMSKKCCSVLVMIAVWFLVVVQLLDGTSAFGVVGLGVRGVTKDDGLVLFAKSGKRKRRRRKEGSSTTSPIASSPPESLEVSVEKSKTMADLPSEDEVVTQEDLDIMKEVASFDFETDGPLMKGIQDDEVVADSEADGSMPPLPDIREVIQRKEQEAEVARQEAEKEAAKVRIKRSDKEAFARLLEQQPYADADDSLFEQEEYNTVSALLAEGSKSFLGIPSGPLQVGHFIGALGIMLMAFVEYPGFPLTNLPTPLRGALQGGLASVFLVNLVLTALAFFQAGARGQPPLLWMTKTLAVGGLAFDQLTQLPTLEQQQRKGR